MATDLPARPVANAAATNPWNNRDAPKDTLLAKLISSDGKPLIGALPDLAQKGGLVQARIIELRSRNEALVDILGKPYLVRARQSFPSAPNASVQLRLLQDGEVDLIDELPVPGVQRRLEGAQPRLPPNIRLPDVKPLPAGALVHDLKENVGDAQVRVSGTARLLAQLSPNGENALGKTLQLPAVQSNLIRQQPEVFAKFLQQMVGQSGLFYESHVKEWSEGRLPLEQLKQEPQSKDAPTRGEQANRNTAQNANANFNSARTSTLPNAAPANTAVSRSIPETVMQALRQQTFLQINPNDTAEKPTPPIAAQERSLQAALQAIPNHIRPIVQEQIQILENGRLIMHGMIDNKPFEVQIDPEEDAREESKPGVAARSWAVNIRMQTVMFGELKLGISLTGNETRVFIKTLTAQPRSQLPVQAGPDLANAFSAHGLQLKELNLGPRARSSTDPAAPNVPERKSPPDSIFPPRSST